MMMKQHGIPIEKKVCNNILPFLMQLKIINLDLNYIKEEEKIIVPVHISELKSLFDTKKNEFLIEYLQTEAGIATIANVNQYDFTQRIKTVGDIKTLLSRVLGKDEIKELISSFDVIGDICIIKVPDSLVPREEIIANTILDVHPNIKVVAKILDFHSGKFRTQKLKILSGEKRFDTIHKENGIRLFMNVEHVYYSPRSATERLRVADQMADSETVLVCFSGAGPFVFVNQKNHPEINQTSIELNPEGILAQKKNLLLNKAVFRSTKEFRTLKETAQTDKKPFDEKKVLMDIALKKIDIISGDVREVIPELKMKKSNFDRIIMPLPHTADEFLDLAFEVSKKGTIIHLYDFLEEDEIGIKNIEKINKIAKECSKKVEILDTIKCGQFSPKVFRICTDIKVITN